MALNITTTDILLGNMLLDALIKATTLVAEVAGKSDEELKAMIDATNEKRRIEIDKVKARQSDGDSA